MNEKPILIVGAGIGGLTAALALLQRGFEVTVLEQAEKLRELGAGVQISPNGTRVLFDLGLQAALAKVAVTPSAKQIRLWNSGETWSLFDLGASAIAEYGFPYLMFHRGDLQMVLANAVREASPDAIRLNAKVADIKEQDDGVVVILESGEVVPGRLVIGADGIHSRTRAGVAGSTDPAFTGCIAWRGVVEASKLPDRLRAPVGCNWVGPGRHVVTYPLRCGELVNFVGVVESDAWTTESWTARGTREDCSADFAGWHEDVHALIESIDVHYRWALMSRPTLQSWSNGSTVLLGDAAHAMLPFMAQGAVMAIEDGLILARCIERCPDDLATAVAHFQAIRLPRANKCVELADRNRLLFHNETLLDRHDAHRYVSTQWNEDKVRDRYDWLFRYDAVTVEIGK